MVCTGGGATDDAGDDDAGSSDGEAARVSASGTDGGIATETEVETAEGVGRGSGDGAEDASTLSRRSLLSKGAGAAVALGGLGAFAGTAAAWGRFEVEFSDCSEVRLVVDEDDLEYDPPLVANVVVSSGIEAVCRTVEFTPANATTVPDEYGERPVVEYSVSGGERVIGVVHYNPAGNPVCLTANDHECTETVTMPSVREADCTQGVDDCVDDANARRHRAPAGWWIRDRIRSPGLDIL